MRRGDDETRVQLYKAVWKWTGECDDHSRSRIVGWDIKFVFVGINCEGNERWKINH